MKVILVISKYLPEYTGAALRLHRLYLSLQEKGIQVQVLCGGIARNQAETWVEGGIPVQRMHDRSSGLSDRWRRLIPFFLDFAEGWTRLLRRDYDVLHVVGTSALTCAALHFAAFSDLPVLHELVTSDARPMQKLPVLGKFLSPRLPRRSALVAISNPLGARCVESGYGGRCWTRPNPVDEKRFFPAEEERQRLRSALTPFSGEDRILLMIAKFMPQKNQLFALEVLAKLPPYYKLILAGPLVKEGPLACRDQDYFRSIQTNAGQPGLKGRVLLLPQFIDRPEDYMRAADVYLMPNRDEGMGTPLLEAQACGLPVVANADEAAFTDFIEKGRTGYLVSNKASDWAEAVMACSDLAPADLLDRAQQVRERFGFHRTAAIYLEILRWLSTSCPSRSLSEVITSHAV